MATTDRPTDDPTELTTDQADVCPRSECWCAGGGLPCWDHFFDAASTARLRESYARLLRLRNDSIEAGDIEQARRDNRQAALVAHELRERGERVEDSA